MKYRTLEPLTLKTERGLVSIPVGKIISLTETQAAKLGRRIIPDDATNRTWAAGWPYRCQCGTPTGWRTDGAPRCPSCEFDRTQDRTQGGTTT